MLGILPDQTLEKEIFQYYPSAGGSGLGLVAEFRFTAALDRTLAIKSFTLR